MFILIKMSQISLKIIGKHDIPNVKNFDNLEQFNDYYKLHEEEINKLSTVKLNQMFHIKDYKIARRKDADQEGKMLCFQQIFNRNATPSQNIEEIASHHTVLVKRVSDMDERIKILELENAKIKQQLLEIINVLNSA